MELKIQRVRAGAQLPQRATAGSAGYDLRALLPEEGVTLAPMERRSIPTGIAIQLPDPQYAACIFARSGLALREGLAMANGVGLIDSDYRGELSVLVVNLSGEALHIQNGQRIAQMVIVPVALPTLTEVESLDDTARGAGGFGSTGKQ